MKARGRTVEPKQARVGMRGRFPCAGGGQALFVGWETGDSLTNFLLSTEGRKVHLALVAWPDGRLTAHHGPGANLHDLDPFGPPAADLGGALRAFGLPVGTGLPDGAEGCLPHIPPVGDLPDPAVATAFAAMLDVDAIRALGPYPVSTPLYAAAAGPRGRGLVERLREVPLLAGLLTPGNAAAIGRAPFGELAGLLSKECGIPLTTALLRRLRGVEVPRGQTRADTLSLLSLLGVIPIDHVPMDGAGVALASELAASMAFLEPGSVPSRVSAPIPRLALRVLKGLGIDAKDAAKPGRIRQVLEDLPLFARDVVTALRDDVLAPAAASRGVDGATESLLQGCANDILFGGASLVEASEVVHAWHRRRFEIERGLPPPRDAAIGWAPPCAPWRGDGGYQVVPLADWAALVAEGDPGSGLDHCVGSRHYALACAKGQAAILSVRREGSDGTVERLGTVEIRPTRHSTFSVVQKKGHANGPFPESASDAFAAWTGDVRAGKGFEWPAAGDYGVAYDHSAPGAVEAALDVWRGVLPARLGGETVASLVDRVVLAVDGGCGPPGPPGPLGPR